MVERVLVARTDRLGDVLLTTPVASAVRASFPSAHIAFLVRPYAAPLLEGHPDIDEVLLDEGDDAAALAARLRAGRFDAAVVAYPRWRMVQAVWRARIPLRVGPANKAYALLLNRPVVQRRSRGERHEADHNLALLAPLGVPFRRFPTVLRLTDAEREEGRRRLASLRRDVGSRPLAVLHPGGGGSAPRWPVEHFMELASRLARAGAAVVVTAGPGEDYAAAAAALDGADEVALLAPGGLTVRQLAGVLAAAGVVVANSTGPLHMAVALGVPTVSIYPGSGTGQPRRWGPYPAYPEGDPAHAVLVAPAGADGSADMARVAVDGVFTECVRRLFMETK